MLTSFRFAAIFLSIVVAGCATDDRKLGYQAEKAKDYVAAREAYRRALTTARQELNARQDQPHKETYQFVVMMDEYELGRMTGYTCDYADAEKLFLEALTLGEQMQDQFSHITATLSELARLSFDEGKFQDSLSYYERAIARLDNFHFVNLTIMPLRLSEPVVMKRQLRSALAQPLIGLTTQTKARNLSQSITEISAISSVPTSECWQRVAC
jgi:tetratricopeptide (TPR) repeat protein